MKIQKITPVKRGDSYYFLIPKDFIDHGNIHPAKEYDLEVTPTDKQAHYRGRK